MKFTTPPVRSRYLGVLLFPVIVAAQVAPAPTPDAATIARYDKNKNGRLESDELNAMEAEQKKPLVPVAGIATEGETVTLSPFEVVADNKGYQATNTMSGTRMNSQLEDIGSAISVITKEQMTDFAMLDINDVFLYAAGAEGTGTYTQIGEDTGGNINDATAGDPANANRIRGIGQANVSVGNFESSNRVPLDPIDSDGVEISRGPNASIFGLGNPSGTVNIVGATANLSRDRSQVAFRADSVDGYRSSLDLSRVLRRGMLAVRVSAVRQHDGFNLKPSGVDSERYNAMMQFRPFKRTTINATYQLYKADGNRPNSIPPQDGISDWRAAGSPTWDPLTSSLRLNGVLTPIISANSPTAYTYVPTSNYGQIYVEPAGITYWGQTYGATGTSPLGALQTSRKVVVTTPRVQDTQPLIGRRNEGVTDRSIYDWQSLNTSAPNYFKDKTQTSRVTLDQVFFDTGRQTLAGQFGWFRENGERFNRYVMSDGGTQGTTGQLSVDINERLLDGTPNPYFLRPFIFQAEPRPRSTPVFSDTYRVQTAYKLDFTRDQGFRRWLGAHSLVGYGEYKSRETRNYGYRDEISSVQPWTFGASPTSLRTANQAVRGIFRFYVGDNQGQNIEYAPALAPYGRYTYNWGNALTGVFNNESVELGQLPVSYSGSDVIQKTRGVLLQNHLLNGRVVTTFGRRADEHFTKLKNPIAFANRGFDFDYDVLEGYRPGDWLFRDGGTETRGVVVKPFRGWQPIDRAASQGTGLTRFFAQAFQGLSLRYNQSDSFLPASPAQNVFFKYLPDPTGEGKDYGFALNLFDNKFNLRVNKYENRQLNSRNGPSASVAAAALALDFFGNAGGVFYGLQEQATTWITAANPGITPDQLNAQLTTLMGIPPIELDAFRTIARSETDDILSRGHEVELHFNPVRSWRLAANFTEQQTINTRNGPNVSAYIAQRLPYWTTIVDPRTGQLWFDRMYTVNETQRAQYTRAVAGALQTAQALQGLARPQIRRYRGNVTTNFYLSGITDHRILKAFNIGGSVRYESQGSIGFFGTPPGADGIYRTYDVTRPVYDKGHIYVDGILGYSTKLWRNKVRSTFQLNVRNLQENGHLQPIAALPDGAPYQYRIVAPRLFILSATFDL